MCVLVVTLDLLDRKTYVLQIKISSIKVKTTVTKLVMAVNR